MRKSRALSVVASIIGLSVLNLLIPPMAWAEEAAVVEKTFDGNFPAELLEKDAQEQAAAKEVSSDKSFDSNVQIAEPSESGSAVAKTRRLSGAGNLSDDENAAIDRALSEEENAAIDKEMAKQTEKTNAGRNGTNGKGASKNHKKSESEANVVEKSFGTNGQLENVVEKSFGANGEVQKVVEKSFDQNGHLENLISQADNSLVKTDDNQIQSDEVGDKAARALAQVNLPKPSLAPPSTSQPNPDPASSPQTNSPQTNGPQASSPQASGKSAKPKFKLPSFDVQKGLKELQEMAGKTVKGLTVGSASFVAGCMVGTPIAICRRTKISTVKSARELYTTEHNPIILVASSPLIFPRGIFNGTMAGLVYGVGNSLCNLDKPFSKACFSIGDFGTIGK
jgi:hypothetical protein